MAMVSSFQAFAIKKFLIVLANLLCVYFINVASVSVEEELTLTLKEKIALDKFRLLVNDILPHEYMKEDIYLIKWLRFQNLDLKAAEVMLKNNLAWREENHMDDILKEDFSYMAEKLPFWLDGRDKNDRPVATADISTWDGRALVLAGRANEGFRYGLQVMENATRMIREDQKNGLNVTQFTLIANLEGFNLAQHVCVQCIPLYLKFLTIYESYYPGMVHKAFMINSPPALEVLLQIGKPILRKQTTDTWAIYGTNKRNWRDAVLLVVDADQIRPQFGGTKPV